MTSVMWRCEEIRRLAGAPDVGTTSEDEARLDPERTEAWERSAEVLLERFERRHEHGAFELLVELTSPRLLRRAASITRQLAVAVEPRHLVVAFFTDLFTDVRADRPAGERFGERAEVRMRALAEELVVRFARAAGPAPAEPPLAPILPLRPRHVVERFGAYPLAVTMSCYHGLDLPDRRILLLREVDGLSYGELGRALGVPAAEVPRRLVGARNRLAASIRRALP